MAELYENITHRFDGPHIRLLYLQPGTINDDDKSSNLEAHLKPVPLETAPCFEALSYTWGAGETVDDIEDNLRLNGVFLRAKENLFFALCYLRHPTRVRVLWVDALCINQDDYEERSAQVAIMDRIYKRADKVLIWLGPDAPWVKGTFKGLERIAESLRHSPSVLRDAGVIEWLENIGVDHVSLARSVAKSGRPHLGPDRGQRFLKNFHRLKENKFSMRDPTLEDFGSTKTLGLDILALLRRDWWSRVWIVQELSLAREPVVVCGRYSAPWDVFLFAAAVTSLSWGFGAGGFAATTMRFASLGRSRLRISRLTHPAEYYLNMQQESSGPMDLLENLSLFRWSKATDARDKIFGLLGISSPTSIIPDYCSPAPACFTAAARDMLERSGTLDLLDFASPPYLIERNQQLPSWVPDWGCYSTIPESKKAQEIELAHTAAMAIQGRVRTTTEELVTASLDSQVEFHGTTSLVLKGMCVDEVAQAGYPLQSLLESETEDTDSGLEEMTERFVRNFSLLSAVFVGVRSLIASSVDMLQQGKAAASNLCVIADLAFAQYTNLEPEPDDDEKFTRLISLLLHGGDPRQVENVEDFRERMTYWEPTPNLPEFLRRAVLATGEASMKISHGGRSGSLTINYAELLIMNFGLRLTVTRDQRFCLTPAGCHPGDQIALLRGGKKPYVIRPGIDRDTWVVIGPCYMDCKEVAKLGEVWRDGTVEKMQFE